VHKLKKTIKSGIKRLVNWSIGLMGGATFGRYVYAQIIAQAMNQTQSVNHGGLILKFSVPNALNRYRADTFSTKEPETIEWIDRIPEGAVVWDIGANVGLYSCYAAKQRGCRVFAFEPSVFNLELLARNIYLNALTDRITIIPLPLSDGLAVSKLNMTSTEWGGALSTFGQSYGHDGKTMQKVFEFPTLGLAMGDAIDLLKIPQPDYIKMDVDGIEHLILKGGAPVLSKVQGVLIEINDRFIAQASDAAKYLAEAGFTMKEKRHAAVFDTGMAEHTFNQIWVR
jgi:FkbM family methyltransferase